jgi:hypothetical protein
MASAPQGIQLGLAEWGISIIAPMTVFQCEHFPIFYNITPTPQGMAQGVIYPADGSFAFKSPDLNLTLFEFNLPMGQGYIDWICDLPAGDSFLITALTFYLYTVHPGSSSDCIGSASDIVTTQFPYGEFYTSELGAYLAKNYPSASIASWASGFNEWVFLHDLLSLLFILTVTSGSETMTLMPTLALPTITVPPGFFMCAFLA